MYQNVIIPYLHEAQRISDDTPPIIRRLNLQWQPLVFHSGRLMDVELVDVVRHRHTVPDNVWKTRGCQCSFRLLMMGGVSSETCWVSYKYGIIKFWYIAASCCFFFMNHNKQIRSVILIPCKMSVARNTHDTRKCIGIFGRRTWRVEASWVS